MAFGGFVKGYLGPSLLGAGSAVIGVWGFLGDAQSLWTAGIKPDYLQLSGFVLFVVATVAVLYRQHQVMELRLSGIGAQRGASSPDSNDGKAPAPAAGPPEAPIPSGDKASRPAGRQYAPKSFVEGYLDLLEEGATDFQRDAYLRPHVGQWMRFSGFMVASADSEERAFVAFSRRSNSGTFVWVYFGPEWKAQLGAIKKGAPMRIDSRIENPEGTRRVELGASELL